MVARWEARVLPGWEWIGPGDAWGTGANVRVHGDEIAWGAERGEGAGWKPAVALHEGGAGLLRNDALPLQLLTPATLPAQLDASGPTGRVRHVARAANRETRQVPVREEDHLAPEAARWDALLRDGKPVAVPAKTRRRVLIDLEDYCCAYPELVVSGGKGALVRVLWEEALYEGAEEPGGWSRARPKGNRDLIEGKYFVGVGDEFLPDGGKQRRFTTLWWQAGRYVELLVETGAAPLVIERFALRETRYPLEPEGRFECSDPRVAPALPLMVHALQMCSHETYMDCPYYEQLMYAGDTRLEVLATYMLTRDDRLPRKALRMFDASRLLGGFTSSRYPSRVRQVIPPFSLWWIGMVHDFATWRGDRAFVRSLMPGVRAVTDAFLGTLNADGLVEAPSGWNYMDWVPGWKDGCPPGGDTGVSGVIS
ncbi:MAG: alpha-L-rhamnosidase, partial [bacterium]